MDRFTFFRSYYEAMQHFPRDVRAELYDAIACFCFEEKEPEFKKPICKGVWTLIRPTLVLSKKQSKNGKKGGAKEGNTNAQKQPKNNPKTTQKQANDKQSTSENEPCSFKGIWNKDNGIKNNTLESVKKQDEPATQHPQPDPEESKYSKFMRWLEANAPYCANPSHMTQVTEEQFNRLRSTYSADQICNVVLSLENRKDKRKQYSSLYRTLLNWLKNENQNGN